MKDFIIFIAIFVLLVLITPMLMVYKAKNVNNGVQTYAATSQCGSQVKPCVSFVIKNGESGKVEYLDGYEFICGVLAGEMPVSYHPNALKAQAVAAFTYCCYQGSRGNVISVPLSIAYLTPAQRRKKWGSSYAACDKKIKSAVSAVYGKAMYYKGEIIDSTFYDMSSGTTENCRDVFGSDLPYLVEVSSPGDTLQKNFISTSEFSLDEFKEAVKKVNANPDFGGKPEYFLQIKQRSGAGGVMSASLCGKTVTGREIRTAFGLRSVNFEVSYTNGTFTFKVKGWGHGVGMSQCGAEYMASGGKSWEDILKWYYKGIDIKNYS